MSFFAYITDFKHSCDSKNWIISRGSLMSIIALISIISFFPTTTLLHEISIPFSGGSVHRTAINFFDSKSYSHHPVILEANVDAVPFRKGYVSEPNGLYVPTRFDCLNVNGNVEWGVFFSRFYFYAVPSRWYACWQYHATLKSGLLLDIPALPLIDEEYRENVAVWDSALRARKKFIMMELGARWGTWASRAVTMLRQKNDIPHEILMIEMEVEYCKGAKEVMEANRIEMELVCSKATPDVVVLWASNKPYIDLLDVDIQTAEKQLFEDSRVMAVVEQKVKRLIVGTHSLAIHDFIEKKFSRWIVQENYSPAKDTHCIENLKMRNNKGEIDRKLFHVIFEKGCYHNSSIGPIVNHDGELILDNPRFSSGQKLFK